MFAMSGEELRFEPLVGADLSSWLASSRAAYVAERLEAGDSEAEADANAARSIEQLVPGGTPASGQHLGRLLDVEGRRVGHLWVGPMGDDPSRWWVWDVAIDADFRGRGYGRSAMRLAERLARDHGASSIGLNVFAHNRVARSLYASLGYTESSVTMRKQLEQPKGGEGRTVT
jgi:ribosomal protein S18 acetylase RimI-like enzyme